MIKQSTKPILVHLHLYYLDMWEQLRDCLKNITVPYELFVTMSSENLDMQKDILEFNADAKIYILENRGFDIAPFIYVLKQVNLDNYDYVIKLHTKRDLDFDFFLNSTNLGGSRWRELLLEFISTKENFAKSLKKLEDNPNIGMLASYALNTRKDKKDKGAKKGLMLFLKKYNLPKKKFSFIAGTMFIARAKIFNFLRENVDFKDFKDSTGNIGTFAHTTERLFGYLVHYNNMRISDGLRSELYCISKRLLATIWVFLYRKYYTSSGKILIKICKIPVFSKRIK